MRRTAIILVACAAVLGASARANPRAPPAVAQATLVETPGLADWMKRLQGRFVVDGAIYYVATDTPRWNGAPGSGLPVVTSEWAQPVSAGKADCSNFAVGPGIHCIFQVDWGTGPTGAPDAADDPEGLPNGSSRLKPGVVLGGLEPSSPGAIRFLLVSDRGLAHPGELTLRGDAATTRIPCVNLPGLMTCEQRLRIEARPEARIIFVTLNVRVVPRWGKEVRLDYSFSLRREVPGRAP